MPGTRKRVPGGAVGALVALALTATACGGDGGGAAPEPTASGAGTPAALRTCQEVFGAANVEAVRTRLGDGFRPFGRALPEVRNRMVAEARAWAPGDDDLRRTTYRPCEMEGGSAGRVTAAVAWSMYDIDSVRSGQGRLRWRTVADGIYVASRPDAAGTPLVMPCTLGGTAEGQGRELPLEVAVLDEGRSEDRSVPAERLLKALAESTRVFLGCEEKLSVPEDLLP